MSGLTFHRSRKYSETISFYRDKIGMDRDDVKELTGIGKNMHIAMVSPLGWPGEKKALPERRQINDFVEGLN
ncbi:MAG: hypothetical protein JXR86_08250 [Spirochaetales bacterium]|nr:hypothetical protein [Spirochaetales bacterium]